MKKIFFRILTLVTILLIAALVALIIGFFLGVISVDSEFIRNYGYPGVFTIVLVFTSSILVPLLSDPFVALAAGVLDPLKVGILTGVASALGECTAYYAGKGGKFFIKKEKVKAQLDKVHRLFDKYGFIMLPIFAFTPLPCDLLGIVAGMASYDLKKFMLGMLLGKIPRTLLVAMTGKIGYEIFFT